MYTVDHSCKLAPPTAELSLSAGIELISVQVLTCTLVFSGNAARMRQDPRPSVERHLNERGHTLVPRLVTLLSQIPTSERSERRQC